jgi:hypothetical protein
MREGETDGKGIVIRLPNYDKRTKKTSPKSAKSHDFVVDLYKYFTAVHFFPTTMTDQELKHLVASLAAAQQKTDNQLRELGKQIGGLGNKFGSFTEGLALPSVERLLFKRFKVDGFSERVRRRKGEDSIELDGLGIANGSRNEAYIVEVKSHLRSENIQQMKTLLAKFRTMFPEYAKMQLFGILAVADASKEALHEAEKEGLLIVSFKNNLMRLHKRKGFEPKAY